MAENIACIDSGQVRPVLVMDGARLMTLLLMDCCPQVDQWAQINKEGSKKSNNEERLRDVRPIYLLTRDVEYAEPLRS